MSMQPEALLSMARRRVGITQRELARRSGVSQPTISRIEAGRMSPTYELLDRLLHACGMEVVTIDRPKEGDVDRTLIRERLRMTPEQRLRYAALEWRKMTSFRERAS